MANVPKIRCVRKLRILYSYGLGIGMLRWPPRVSVDSVGGTRRRTVRCCMFGRSILKSVALQKRMSVYD